MRIFLLPLALIYKFIHGLRRRCYESGLLRAKRLSKPVISVGNLSAGGTGKTPFVDCLLTQLEARGLKCCVLTRGYGRSDSGSVVAISSHTASEVGDEPLWLHSRHPQSIIVVGSDRVKSAQIAGPADIYILDDGLQHLKIFRDLEITLIDSSRPLSHYNPLPWGFARDGFDVLRRSDLVVLTRSNQASPEQLDLIADIIFKNGVLDLIESSFEIQKTFDLVSNEMVSISGKKVYLVSGVGNPMSFESLIKSQSDVVFHEKKKDHFVYSAANLIEIEKMAVKTGAEMILTTEKDAVKLRGLLKNQRIPWVVVSINMIFDPELPKIYDLVSHSSH